MKTLLIYFNLDGFAVQIKNHIEDALDELGIEWKEAHISEAAQVSQSFVPTMQVFFHPNRTIIDYLDQIKELKGHKLLWDMESPYESDLVFDLLPYFYYIFCSDENTTEALKKEGTANQIFYVPHACNPKVHKPMEVPYEYKSDILFVGNAYESRIEWFQKHAEEYKEKMVTLIGVGYRGLDGYQNQRVIHDHISEPEMVKYINGAKLVLNLHRQKGDLDMGNSRELEPGTRSFNNRYYEVEACLRPQLVVGRGETWETTQVLSEADQIWIEENSYKARLVKYYLPLLKGIGK